MEYSNMQSVVETLAFIEDVRALRISNAERATIIAWVAENPTAGDVIEGTGGARKVRFGGRGKGKSGGYRVITFFSGADIPVFLLNIFAKNEKVDLSGKERTTLKILLSTIAQNYKRRPVQ